jgi:hypothetical protein
MANNILRDFVLFMLENIKSTFSRVGKARHQGTGSKPPALKG